MDFARKQLEKYGWTDGKGLGKNETGISEALKPKLKRSVTGIGYDPAKDFTEHWWSELYNKAASNVQVEEEEGKTKKIKQKDESFEITNSTWHMRNKKNANTDEEYVDFFVKTEVLDNDGTKIVKNQVSESSDASDGRLGLTDEQLFTACGGRTAHKGARHGLRALGKLARIEQQEKVLLQESRFKGYSQFKKNNNTSESQVVEVALLNSDQEQSTLKQKKKKKKRCSSLNLDSENNNNDSNICDRKEEDSNGKSKKRKKEKIKDGITNESDVKYESVGNNEVDTNTINKKKKKYKNNECIENIDKEVSIDACTENNCKTEKCEKKDSEDCIQIEVRKKRKKMSTNCINPDDLKVTVEIDQISEKVCKKIKKKMKSSE